jgi:hypothetical protein
MNIRSISVAAVAVLAASAAFARAPESAPAEPQAALRVQTLIEELAAGMREVLRAVAPEISLPAIEIKLPKLDGAVG